MTSRRFAFALGAVMLVGVAVRIAFVVAVDPKVPEVGDASAYHLLANDLASGRGYIRPFDRTIEHVIRPTAEYPPGWPFVLSLADRAGIDTVRGQRLAAVSILGAATIGLTGLIGRRVRSGAIGLVAAGLVAAHPLVFQGEATLMAEALYVPLMAALLLIGLHALEPPGRWQMLAALGTVGGLATLTRAEAALTTALIGLVVVASLARPRLLLALALPFLLVVGGWTVRNQVRFHRFVPISNNLASAVDGANCPSTYAGSATGLWSYSPDCFDGFGQRELGRDGEAVVAARHRSQGVEYARAHLGSMPRVVGVRVLRTWGVWNPAQTTGVASFEGRDLGWERAGAALQALISIGAVLGAWRLRHQRWTVLLLIIPAFAATVTVMVTYGSQRFLAGALPALCVLTACALPERTSA